MPEVTSIFSIVGWDETPYGEPDGGPRLSRATVRKTFEGSLKGESTAELLMCQANPEELNAGAGYVASEQFVGSLDGREGSFVMQHAGLIGADREQQTFGHVVPGSGTGGLAGLTGSVEISVADDGTHTLTLDYGLA